MPAQRSAGEQLHGWQQAATAALDKQEFEALLSDLDPSSRALLLSQAGPYSSRCFVALPSAPELRIASPHFRVMALRRLRLPLPLDAANCRCGRPVDALGDHRAACATSGVLRARALPLEWAVARICREAGARVSTNVALSHMNLHVPVADARQIEVMANGLPLWHGSQLAVDTTLVSPLGREGQVRGQADTVPGCTVQEAGRRKRTQVYPEFVGSQRCRLVVFGLEVGGRWADEAASFIHQLARSRARSLPAWAQAAATAAWAQRWSALAAIAAQRALAASLLEQPLTGEDA